MENIVEYFKSIILDFVNDLSGIIESQSQTQSQSFKTCEINGKLFAKPE